MQVQQYWWKKSKGWRPNLLEKIEPDVQLVLVFGSTAVLQNQGILEPIKAIYPQAIFLGCSTAGEICGTQVFDDSLVVTAVQFAHTRLQGAMIKLDRQAQESSFQAGERLAKSLPSEDLTHVFLLSDGLAINGSELVKGLAHQLPASVTITGGLAGDGANFAQTLVLWDGVAEVDTIAAVGFYGDRLQVSYGSLGGWSPFGPERRITKSQGNILYELDGESALGLYKKYLGEQAAGLPATGLLFPLGLRLEQGEELLVRTILAINEADQSLTFAGDVPEGALVQLMKASFDNLVAGAIAAATTSYVATEQTAPELAILISCVGRKLVLKQQVEEEVEGVQSVLGVQSTMTGFYSYGEISPFKPGVPCELHNQTMTITTFTEV
jgi:hypothetical protein